MRIVLLANRHHDEPSAGHGHWLNHEYRESCVRNGAEFLLVAPKVSTDPKCHAVLALDRLSRGRLTHLPLLGLRADLAELRPLLKDNPSQTILHVYEGGLREFLLVAKLASEIPNLRIVFNFNLSDPWHIAALSKSHLAKHVWRFLSLTAHECEKSVVFTAETKELGSLISTRLGLHLREYALTPNVPFELVEHQSQKLWDFFVPVFGDKELALVVDALLDLRKRTGKLYRVRIQPRWSEPLSSLSLSRLKELGVDLLPSVVSQEMYVTTLTKARVVVLPYLNLDYYRLQTSGRVLDAVALGARVIVPAATSLSRQVLERSWGYDFNSSSSQSLATAMERSLQDKADPQSRFTVISPFTSIVTQASHANVSKQVKVPIRGKRNIIKVRLLAASWLFLVADFRSLLSGFLGLAGMTQETQARLVKLVPRKQAK